MAHQNKTPTLVSGFCFAIMVPMMQPDLPIMTFETVGNLREWLESNHTSSTGILVRIYKKGTNIPSVSFEEVLEEGLCFGWSESMRLKGDDVSYLQKFTPRKTKGTTSERNRRYAKRLIEEGRMTLAGRTVLGI